MRMRPVVVAVALVALSGAACSGSDSETVKKDPSATELAQAVGIRRSDVKANDKVALIAGGDQVAGQVTLDLCGATFPSEQKRKVRNQVSATLTNGDSAGVGSEAVLYESPAAAQQALDELRMAQKSCPKGFADSHVQGVPNIKTTFAAPPDAKWPKHAGIDRLSQDITLSTEEGRSLHKLLIFQVRGAMLVGLYVTPEIASKHINSSIDGVEGLANTVAKRLEDLPASALANAPAV